MKRILLLTGFLGLMLHSFAFATTPNNVTVNCQFEGIKDDQSCHLVANLHFQGGADDHLLVNCPGLGQNTIVYNDDAEFSQNGNVTIEPDGSSELPKLTLPADALDCRQNPVDFDATLELPERAPYDGETLDGVCQVVTAGCPSAI